MAVSINDIPKDSQVYRFITAGKRGRCRFCQKMVEKLEAHHVAYSPEVVIKLCHRCHHKVHYFPNRLEDHEKLLLLQKKFSPEKSIKLLEDTAAPLTPELLCELVAPSRRLFVRKRNKDR